MSEGRSTAERTEEAATRDDPSAKGAREQPKMPEGRKGRDNSPVAAERAEAKVAGGYDELATLNRAGIQATLQAGEAMLKATSSLAEELTSFACKRLDADLETGRSLISSSSDLEQAMKLQGQFAADAMRDYLEEMTRIAQLAAQTTRDVWAPLQEFSARLGRGEGAHPS
jgi:hypothetical protein